MAKESQRRHPPDALLHAYVAGELDPATRAAIISHLGRCGECREVSGRVEGLRTLIADTQPQGFDELKWRRISQGVMTQLETEALSLHAFGNGSRTQWTIAALAAAAAVALLVWFAPRPTKPKMIAEAPPPAVTSPVITSGDTPFELQLPQGLQLHLSEGARLVARSTVPTDIDLELQLGELDVRALAPLDPKTPIKVRTPDFVAEARSRDFSVGYQSAESFVAVRDGEVELDPGDKVVKKGETHTIRHQEKAAALEEPEQPREKIAAAKKREQPAVEEPEEETAKVEEQPETDEPGGPKPIDRDRTQRMSSEGETSVKVIPPPEDEWARKLRLANEAYSARQYDKALILATEIVEHAGMRGEVPLAKQMVCDLYITTKRSDRAVVACSELLLGATDEDARAIHRHLATIYRKDLNDCKNAIVHYTQAIVFGRNSPFDEEPLIWRAHCELEVGDLKAARSDINALERRAASLVRPAELAALKKRLLQASQR